MTSRTKITSTSTLFKYTFNEISDSQKKLVDASIEAAQTAFAPFSNFKVGAAALLTNGTIVIGSNQENVAYPSGLCAERVALFACGAQHNGQVISHLSVYVDSFENKDEIPLPCGSCRQVINQSEVNQKNDISIFLVTKNKDVYVAKNSEVFLPFPFKF